MNRDGGDLTRATRVYRALLKAFPVAFRQRHEEPMVDMFRDAYRGRDMQSRRAALAFWIRTIRDVSINGLSLRVESLSQRERTDVNATRHGWLDSTIHDVRFGLRALLRDPTFSAVAILTIALAIGANTAIFTVVNTVLLRPLPYPSADRLVVVWTQFPNDGQTHFPVSPAEYLDYRAQTTVFESMGAFSSTAVTLTGDTEAARVAAVFTTASLIETLGFAPHLGRIIDINDDQPGAEPVAVLGYDLWSRRYGGDPSIVGRKVTVNGNDVRVVGIMRPGVAPPQTPADIWMALGFDRATITDRSGHFLTVVARLSPTATFSAALAELDATLARWETSFAGEHTPGPKGGDHTMALTTLTDTVLASVRPSLMVLLGSVALVLILACANVANLLLARGEARRREIGLRAALGAGRGRIARQLLTESAVVAALGGALGLGIAITAVHLLPQFEPGTLPRVEEISVDLRVLLFTGGVSVLTGLVFGALPAIRASRGDLAAAIKTGARAGGPGRDGHRTLRLLVVAQMSLAVMLLVACGLLVKSFRSLQRVDPGIARAGRVVMDVALPASRYADRQAISGFYRRALDDLQAIPGVQSAAAVRNLPLRAGSRLEGVDIEGRAPGESGGAFSADYQAVTAGYFQLMGIPLVTGRVFSESDGPEAPSVALINETMARLYWPEGDPTGDRIRPRFAPDAGWITIVGVVGDVRQNGLAGDLRPELYLPIEQTPASNLGFVRAASIVIRTSGDAAAAIRAAQATLRSVDPDVPATNTSSMDQVVSATLRRERFVAMLLTVFAVVAVSIASVGVYGVITFVVARSRREIGVRIALGAQPRTVLASVVRFGASLAAMGCGIGWIGALWASRLLDSLLFGVEPRDLGVFATAGIGLLLVGAAAAALPAHRASTVDPITALRGED